MRKNTGMKSKWTMCSLTLRFFTSPLSFFFCLFNIIYENIHIFLSKGDADDVYVYLLTCLPLCYLHKLIYTNLNFVYLFVNVWIFFFSSLTAQKTNKKCVKMCEKLFFAKKSKMMLQFNLFRINIAWLIVSILILLPLSSCILLEELSPGEWKI
jgi:hypothetical protein